ncbi:MAG: hypothetical protein U1E58_10260 [Tabrizicola sp.]
MQIKLTILALAAVFAVPALADAPNRTTMGWKEYAEASGCIFVKASDGTTTNLALASDPSDPCPAKVFRAFWGSSSKRGAGPDGVLGTSDDTFGPASDN